MENRGKRRSPWHSVNNMITGLVTPCGPIPIRGKTPSAAGQNHREETLKVITPEAPRRHKGLASKISRLGLGCQRAKLAAGWLSFGSGHMENFGSGPSLHPAPHCTTTGEWRVLNCKKTQQYFVFGSSTLSKISNPKPPPTSFRILQQQPPGGTYPTNGKRKPHTQKYLGIWFLSSQQLICMINQDYIYVYIYIILSVYWIY